MVVGRVASDGRGSSCEHPLLLWWLHAGTLEERSRLIASGDQFRSGFSNENLYRVRQLTGAADKLDKVEHDGGVFAKELDITTETRDQALLGGYQRN